MKELIKKKELIRFLIKKNVLISSEFIDDFMNYDLKEVFNKFSKTNLLVLNKDTKDFIQNSDFNWFELDKSKVLQEKNKNIKIYNGFLDFLRNESKKKPESVKVIFSYNEKSRKRGVQDFISFFNTRYKNISNMFRNRLELQNIVSINKLWNKKDKEEVSLIALVRDKQITKNKNILLTVEDTTGTIKIIIGRNKTKLYERCKEIVLDEVIAIMGVNSGRVVFANNVLWPDVPNKELKKAPDEAYAIFLSDLHIGSEKFLSEEFNRFLKWINCQVGDERQKAIAQKTKYVFIVGDLVDGVGIYPGQEKELAMKDIYQQYASCAQLLKKIPQHIKLMITPGNHDAMRLAEPQPSLYKDFAEPIWQLPNVVMLSNPSMVNIHSSKSFSGFDILLYHGYSFDYFVANVESIRNQGGYDRADLIMRFLLKRRHLAPTHKSTLYIPDMNKDPLVIEKTPDFFVSGHIHKTSVSNYKGITLISGSCWQAKTPFQEKVGHHPEPARVPVVNLQTREIKILKFG